MIRGAEHLEVWVDGSLHGFGPICTSSLIGAQSAEEQGWSSFAARAILKSFYPARESEYRNPVTLEVYRYDAERDVVYQFGC